MQKLFFDPIFIAAMKKKKIVVLGAGMIGSAIAADLAADYDVTAVDANENALKEARQRSKIKTVQTDLSKAKNISAHIKKADLVIGAVPGFMGFNVLKTIISAGKNVVDISFFPEDPFALNKLAQQKKVSAIVDCGVAPGLSNIIAGFHHQSMFIKKFFCYVGGLPKVKTNIFEYKAPFSPADVLEEYTRPARVVEEGKEIIKPALSEIELLEFNHIGTLEAFNSDGLRSLLKTIDIPEMKEKTLRYPGHAKSMELLRNAGFLSKENINVNGKKTSPLDVTSAILFPQWKLEKNEEEFTVMRILIEGEEAAKHMQYTYDLYDTYDKKTATTSMARTTGYTCTAAARLVIEGDYDQKGISPPEYLGARENCFEFIIKYLREKGVILKVSKS